MTNAQTAQEYAELHLAPNHERLLIASAIAPAVAKARHYASILNTPAVLADCGFSGPQQQLVPGLLIHVHPVLEDNPDPRIVRYQFRPDTPRVQLNGKLTKYETPAGSHMAVDAHPFIRTQLRDPSVPLYVTEGLRKVDAAISQGLCCIGLLGVWNWRGANAVRGLVALADWNEIALRGREIFIIYDSDVMRKPEVQKALVAIAAYLAAKGARPQTIILPEIPEEGMPS
jgi:hypothetical protein